MARWIERSGEADNIEIALPHPRSLDMKTQERFGAYPRRTYKFLGME